MDWMDSFYQWFMSLGAEYGVNPIIFGAIYVGAIPFFTLSVAWIIRNHKKNKPVTLPVVCAIFCFISAYLYLMIAGENVPWWAYMIVMVMVLYGGWSTFQKIKAKVESKEKTADEKNV